MPKDTSKKVDPLYACRHISTTLEKLSSQDEVEFVLNYITIRVNNGTIRAAPPKPDPRQTSLPETLDEPELPTGDDEETDAG